MVNIKKFKPKGLKISTEEKSSLIELGYSWCCKCSSTLLVEKFGKDKSNAYGFEPVCKECRREAATARRKNFPERVKEIRRNHRNKFSERYNKASNEWKRSNRDKVNSYRRKKYNDDPLYKMQIACRNMVKKMFNSIGSKKDIETHKILGYTPKELKEHLEKQFTEGMNWENYGDWHIDHIRPISSAASFVDGLQLSQLSNLQPMWAEENISKGNKIK